MFPIRDLNSTQIRPWVTYALIAANIAIFLLWQPTEPRHLAEPRPARNGSAVRRC